MNTQATLIAPATSKPSIKTRSRKSRTKGRKSSSTSRARKTAKHQTAGTRLGRRPTHITKVIEVLVQGNPRRKGTAGFKSFELYKPKMTVGEYFVAGGRSNDLAWDIKHGFVKLVK